MEIEREGNEGDEKSTGKENVSEGKGNIRKNAAVRLTYHVSRGSAV